MDRVRALRRPELAHLEELPRHPCCRTVRAMLHMLMWQRDHIAASAVDSKGDWKLPATRYS
jgi:hypothetical protein